MVVLGDGDFVPLAPTVGRAEGITSAEWVPLAAVTLAAVLVWSFTRRRWRNAFDRAAR